MWWTALRPGLVALGSRPNPTRGASIILTWYGAWPRLAELVFEVLVDDALDRSHLSLGATYFGFQSLQEQLSYLRVLH